MTGLDVEKDQILEMACLITDCDLNVLAEVSGPGGTPRLRGMLEQRDGRRSRPGRAGAAAPRWSRHRHRSGTWHRHRSGTCVTVTAGWSCSAAAWAGH